MDLGGVLEFYPSRRILTRIDVGDTIIHYSSDSFFPFSLPPQPTTRNTHNLQISAGIGFRFGSLPPENPALPAHHERLKRFEAGAQFSSLGLQQTERFASGFSLTIFEFRDTITQAGFGGRLTFNLTRSFAWEVQGDFYPKELPYINNGRAGGRITQVQTGLKAGKRFDKFGVFAKARPGIVSFSGALKIEPTPGFPSFRPIRENYFSFDLGGIIEFYPSSRIVTRFDGGDTMIHYRSIDNPIVFFPAVVAFHSPPVTTHNFQFSAGVGFRF